MIDRPIDGHIIFLNGTSSSGKGSIASALLDVLPDPYIHIGYDDLFLLHRSGAYFGVQGVQLCEQVEVDREPIAMEIGPLATTYFAGMHHAVAAFAAAGNNLIVDWVLWDTAWLHDFVDLLRDSDVLFVGVHCTLPEAERRERERGDRLVGLTRSQSGYVHTHGIYDVTVDTSVATPTECAAQIVAFLATGKRPAAFARLRGEESS